MTAIPTAFAESIVRRAGDAGRTWIDSLPELTDDLLRRWSCRVAGPTLHGLSGIVIPTDRADGSPAALKLSFPPSRNIAEPIALEKWNGNGAVRLLERDDDRAAMLLERLHAAAEPDPAPFSTVGMLVRRLAVPAPPQLPTLADKLSDWTTTMRALARRLGDPLDTSVIGAALANARNLTADQPAVLVHGDLHLGNILHADDGPRAIDPHGLVGDPAYDFLQVLRGDWNALTAEPNLGRAVDRRAAEFAEAAELDRDRVRRWAQVRATASALWLRDLQKPESAIAIVDTLASLLTA